MNTNPSNNEAKIAYAVLLVMPLMFSTNIIFGRSSVSEIEPFTLACIRWGGSALILLPFVYQPIMARRGALLAMAPSLFAMGFLGMWIAGAIVYLALKHTTATNATLIYTSSPVIIIIIEAVWFKRKIVLRELLGIAIAVLGVGIIVFRGDLDNLLALHFNPGDVLIFTAATGWAIYSVALRSEKFAAFQTLPLFALIAASGALLLLPFAAAEIVIFDKFPTSQSAWTSIFGIIVLSSLLAFSMFQYGVKVLGPSITGISLYLLPVYGTTLAVVFLGETLEAHHIWGILTVLGGVILATLPKTVFRQSQST